jgi:hypothetical protein
MRAAHGTGDGFGVESAVGRVGVFGGASGAQRKAPHGGVGAVIGRGQSDGIARSAIGAVGERILKTAVGRISDFGEALGTGGKIGRDEGEAGVARSAGRDLEVWVGNGFRDFFDETALDFGGEWSFRAEGFDEGPGMACFVGIDFNDEAAGSVEGDAGKVEAVGEFLDEGAETDALDDALQNDAVARKTSSYLIAEGGAPRS